MVLFVLILVTVTSVVYYLKKEKGFFNAIINGAVLSTLFTIIINAVAYAVNFNSGKLKYSHKTYRVEKFYGLNKDTIAEIDNGLILTKKDYAKGYFNVNENKAGNEYFEVTYVDFDVDDMFFLCTFWKRKGIERTLHLNKENYNGNKKENNVQNPIGSNGE